MDDIRHQKRLDAIKKWRKSVKGRRVEAAYRLKNKEKHKAYKKSAKYKQYIQSDKYKESQKEYARSPKMKAWKKEYNKEYHQTNKYKDYQNQYLNSKEGKSVLKKYRQKLEYKEYHKKYQIEFRLSEHGKEWTRRWNQSSLGKYLRLKQKLLRRERENNCIHSFSKEEWKSKCESTNGVCLSCNNKFDNGLHKLTLDHIFALYWANEYFKQTGKKWKYTIDGVQPICLSCNCSKRDKLIESVKPKDLNTQQSNTILVTQ